MAKAKAALNPGVTPAMSEGESKFFETRGEEDIPAAASEPAAPELPIPEPTTPEPLAAEPEEIEEEHAPDAAGTKPPKGYVSVNALREEREKRRAKEQEFTVLNTRLETLMQLANAQQQQAQTQQQQTAAPEIPDVTVDPVGHFKAKNALLEQQVAQLANGFQQQNQQQTVQSNIARLTQIATAQEQEFSKTTPDYQEAAEFVKGLRDMQLQALGATDPAQRQILLQQEAMQIAAGALQNNKNPASVIYDIAKASGWKPKPAGQSSASVDASAAAMKGALASAITPAKQVQMAAAGQVAGQSLGQVNGSSTPPTTLESLLKLSDKEFAEKTKGDKWRELLEPRR